MESEITFVMIWHYINKTEFKLVEFEENRYILISSLAFTYYFYKILYYYRKATFAVYVNENI